MLRYLHLEQTHTTRKYSVTPPSNLKWICDQVLVDQSRVMQLLIIKMILLFWINLGEGGGQGEITSHINKYTVTYNLVDEHNDYSRIYNLKAEIKRFNSMEN